VGNAALCESAGGLRIEKDVVEVEERTVVEDDGSEDGRCGGYGREFAEFPGGGGEEEHLSA